MLKRSIGEKVTVHHCTSYWRKMTRKWLAFLPPNLTSADESFLDKSCQQNSCGSVHETKRETNTCWACGSCGCEGSEANPSSLEHRDIIISVTSETPLLRTPNRCADHHPKLHCQGTSLVLTVTYTDQETKTFQISWSHWSHWEMMRHGET